MKKLYQCMMFVLQFFLMSQIAQAQIQMDKDDFMQKAKLGMGQNSDYIEMMQNAMDLLDLNNDKIISENEIKLFAEGMDVVPNLTSAQKNERKNKVFSLFKQEDANHNNQLDGSEIKNFMDKIAEVELEYHFKKMDRNNDGVWDEKDIPSLEESQAMLDKSLEQMKEAVAKLEKLDPKEMANNMFNNMLTAQADEDFFQMDKDKNGCVSKEEYADYQVKSQENQEGGSEYRLSYDDYLQLYADITKKKKDCLTKEEYVKDVTGMLENLDDVKFEEVLSEE